MSKEFPVTKSWQQVFGTRQVSKQTVIVWRNFVRQLSTEAVEDADPMGGPDEVVRINESLFRVRRKYNRGRVPLGNDCAAVVATVGRAGITGGAVAADGAGAVRGAGAASGVEEAGGLVAAVRGAGVACGAGTVEGAVGSGAARGAGATGRAGAAGGAGSALGVGAEGGAVAGGGAESVGGAEAAGGNRKFLRHISGPWAFGVLWVRTGELRHFRVWRDVTRPRRCC